jgi:hypothetical protein
MSKENNAKTKRKDDQTVQRRQPWLAKSTGYTAITVISIGLAVWVAWQSILGGSTFWSGALLGLAFGASIWLVFFGMNYFHGLFNKTNHKKQK